MEKKRVFVGLIAFACLGLVAGCSVSKKSSSSSSKSSVKSSVSKKQPLTFIKSSYSEPHIWYDLPGDLGSTGKSAIPSTIFVVNKGKATEYDTSTDFGKYDNYFKSPDEYNQAEKILDSIPTIGDYSKMSDAKVISTAKQVDKELFDLDKKIKTQDSVGLGNTYSYADPTPRPTSVSYETDKTGNNVSSETVKISKSYRLRNLDTEGTSQFQDTEMTFNGVTQGYTQVYNNKYYGYITNKGSSNQRFYMTKLGKNDSATVSFDHK